MNSGKTYDNLNVLPEHGLRLAFSLPCVGETHNSEGVGASLEFNTNAAGRRFPYIVLWLGRWTVQMGWLWG